MSSFSNVALEAMQERMTLSELSQKYEVHPHQITAWKKQLMTQSVSVFKEPLSDKNAKDKLIDQLYKTIGELTMDMDFLKKYPYLLRNLTINHPNHIWELDISYIPMRHGYMYLFAIFDVYSRYVVGWSLNNTMTAGWCCSVLGTAIATHGKQKSSTATKVVSLPLLNTLIY